MNDSMDIGNIVGKLTENPEVMKNLMGIAEKIMNKDDTEPLRCDKQEEEKKCPVECGDKPLRKDGGFRVRSDDAENLIRLLIALKPYVGESRCEKIDGIVRILKLVQLSEKSGLLKSLL